MSLSLQQDDEGTIELVFSIDHSSLEVLDWTGANFKINIM